jgi:hypothetical protein
MDDEREDQQLPASYEDEHGSGGFDQPDGQTGRVIVGPIEKFVDGDWTTGGLPADPKRRLAAVGTDVIIQRWREQRVIEVFVEKPLPNLELLNEAAPKDEWEEDLNGNPRPPYQRASIVHLLNIGTAERTTFISATKGAAIAVRQLKDQVKWMRKLRGADGVVPQVELGWAPFPTRYGMRKRPDFKLTAWVDLSSGQVTAGPKQLAPVEPKKVKPPSTKEALDDEIPF